MVDVDGVVQLWEQVIAGWQAGDSGLPPRLRRWRESYNGRGAGRVDRQAMPEPYLGSWHHARAAMLAVHPGRSFAAFQHRGGHFDRAIADVGSYQAWAEGWPFVNPPWTDAHPPARHTTARLRFLRDWFEDPELGYDAMLGLELYPWHVTSATAPMRPPPDAVRAYVWEPLVQSGIATAFAFGAARFDMLETHFGAYVVARLGTGGTDYRPRASSRSVLVCDHPNGLRVIAEKHRGSSGPPATDETQRLRAAIDHL